MNEKRETPQTTHHRLSVLRIVNRVTETSAPYNQFSLPLSNQYNISVCTYYDSPVYPAQQMQFFPGDGTVCGYFRALRSALSTARYDLIHVHSPLVAFWFLLATFRQRKALPPTVVTIHNSYENFKLRNRLLLLLAFMRFQRVVCCSRSAYKSFPRLYHWLGGARVCFVQNGVNLERIDRVLGAKAPCRDPNRFNLVCVSRLTRIKNVATLFLAFRRAADVSAQLKLIGDGDLRDDLIAERNRLDLRDQVELTGLLTRNAVYEALRCADLFVSTSWGEGLPVATLEAMACGCPVLLSDIPPHREIAQGANFIPLVPPDDVAGFAREIKRFRQMSPAERQLIGQRCRKHAHARFSLTAMHDGYARLYAELLAAKHPAMKAA